MSFDSSGQLAVRGPISTDEGGFRDDFGAASFNVASTGTAAFTNGSKVVTGTGFLAEGLNKEFYIKATAHSSTYFTKIAHVESDTLLYLADVYGGANAAVAIYTKSLWSSVIVGSGTIGVASSIVTLTGSTGTGQVVEISRETDYLPLKMHARCRVTQRVANQEVFIGFSEGNLAGARAYISFTGTDNTKARLITTSSTNPSDLESTEFSAALGLSSAIYADYNIVISSDAVRAYVDNVLVATHYNHIPGPYDTMSMVAGVGNSGAVASATSLLIDVIFISNFDLLDIAPSITEEVRSVLYTIGATGAVASNSSGGFASHSIIVTGTWAGTLVAETSSDGGVTWIPSSIFVPSATKAGAGIPTVLTAITANGTYRLATAGSATNIQARASAWTSGTATIRLTSTTTSNMFSFTNSAMIQNVVASTLNSIPAGLTLAASAGWTGSSESTLGVAAIQVMAKADQALTVYVDQSNDGTNWDVTDNYTTFAAIGTARTIQALGSYYRVRVFNNSATTATTYTRVGTALCPVVEVVPRTLGQKLASRSLAVTMAQDQDGINVTSDLVFSTTAAATFNIATTETNYLLIRNPGASGKNLYIDRFIADLATSTEAGIFRVYFNPTSISGGTAGAITNRFIGSAVTSDMTTTYASTGALITATTSAANRLFSFTKPASQDTVIFDCPDELVLKPGNDIIVTAFLAAKTSVATVTVLWKELTIAQ